MKLTVLILTLVLLSASFQNSFSQAYGWYSQTSGTTNNLNNVFFLDNNTGYVVGNSGTILKTTNGGTNWAVQVSGVPSHLFSVYFVNSSTGYAAGDVGTILKTTNGGANWVSQNSTVPYLLDGITFSNASTGVIVGWYTTVLRTTNGGANWTQVTGISIESQNLNTVHFYDANTGTAAGNLGKIIKTTNGGVNWTPQTSGITFGFESVCYLGSSSAVLVVGEAGNIRKTTNSGTTWTSQSSGVGVGIRGVYFINQNTGVYVGDAGNIRRTSNSGSTWISQVSNTSTGLNKVYFSDSINGTAVGNSGSIRHTSTGGWLLPVQPTLTSPANNAGCIALTPNLDWNDVAAPTAWYTLQVGINNNFDTLVLDQNNIVVSNYNIPVNALNNNKTYYWRVKADNSVGTGPWSAARTFVTKNPSPSSITLTAPANNGTAIPLTPLLNWDDGTSISGYRLQLSRDTAFSLLLLDSSGISSSQFNIPAGMLDNNTSYYWRVNGSNSCETGAWSSKWKFTTTVELPAVPILVSPPDNTIGLSLTPSMDWLDIANAETYKIIISSDSAFITSEIDSANISVSGFTVPASVLSSFTWYYWKITGVNEAGEGISSAVWKFQTQLVTGLANNSSQIPDKFGLKQNYPNPFNPVTNIKFDLPKSGKTSLTVYSINGSLAAKLVEAELGAGSYSYVFDASRLSSGVYYYRLQSGDFTETRRLVLIK